MGKKAGVAVLTLTTQEEWETLLEEEVDGLLVQAQRMHCTWVKYQTGVATMLFLPLFLSKLPRVLEYYMGSSVTKIGGPPFPPALFILLSKRFEAKINSGTSLASWGHC